MGRPAERWAEGALEHGVLAAAVRAGGGTLGPIQEGHVSSALCHLGNMSHRVGRATSPPEFHELVKPTTPVGEAYGRMIEHLGANNIDLSKTPLTAGMPLLVDPKAEQCTGPDAARAVASEASPVATDSPFGTGCVRDS